MSLLKTTKIPLDNNELALAKYTELIESNKSIILFLGNSESIQKGLTLADKLVRLITANETLWVMLAGNHIDLHEMPINKPN